MIADLHNEDPWIPSDWSNIDEERSDPRADLKKQVQATEALIQRLNVSISSIDKEIAILNQGEPPSCHGNDCQVCIPWQHVTMVIEV